MTIRLTWARAATALLGLAVAGLLFAWSGVFNVAASSGHWAVTDWFLHWTMRNSVRTYAAFTAPAEPADAAGLVSAAGLYDTSCAVCHGAPGRRPSPVMQAATPPAPDLTVTAREWSDAELFRIIAHGVKFTGMPAWGAPDRPDEVRRMVAFVRRLPAMSPAAYRALAGPRAGCTTCHGGDGRGRGQADIPILGGQRPAYLLAALKAYAAGTRHSAVMGNAAAALSDADMRSLAGLFAAMPGLGTAQSGGSPAARAIVERGLPQRQLPACISCHAPGRPYPILTGQRAAYIAQRLRRWRGEEAVVDARKSHATMPVIARRIPEALIDPVAELLAGPCGAGNADCARTPD
ncbi:c-type cytochrome [Sphingomonas profundi]|uniref:c-type cytochrome n=1 Tax=Alterirhizorhabdus profundi TaxID=2681549 RepID=UPI0012E97463|nr:c-type cytochrome [Sphingomonas profundi]